MKEIFLKQGWAGRTITRQETADRVNDVIRAHMALNHGYQHLIDTSADPEAVAELSDHVKTARADVGKLAETVYSNGGTAFTGVEMEPADFAAKTDEDLVSRIREQEEGLQALVSRELKDVEHHMRTRAILGVVQTNSQARLNALRNLGRTIKR